LPVFALVVLLQWTHGAYRAEFGAHPDEAAHYVTGLMVHDYIAAGLPRHPFAYARNYYNHYPKVALGNWPPGFYLIQSAWTLAFSPDRVSVLLLMAFMTGLVALLVIRALAAQLGVAYGVLGGALFIAFPLVQQYSARVMTEVPVALFSLLATLSFARYLRRGRTSDSVIFGLFASAAIMTKGTGLALALVPPLAVLSRAASTCEAAELWWPVAIVSLLCGPGPGCSATWHKMEGTGCFPSLHASGAGRFLVGTIHGGRSCDWSVRDRRVHRYRDRAAPATCLGTLGRGSGSALRSDRVPFCCSR
jgi:hypothetical protein